MAQNQNCAVFKSNAFNTTIRKEYFLNPDCFGDDAAAWLIRELRAREIETDEVPDQEDFGWYFKFNAGGAKHNALIGFRPGSYGGEGEWICWIERKTGLFGVLLGKRKTIRPEAVRAIQDILTSSKIVSGVKFCSEQDL